MPTIGEIRSAREIGYSGRAKYAWNVCSDCGKERWSYLAKQGIRCWACAAQHRARAKQPITYLGVGNPQFGDVALAKSLGYASRGVYFYDACPDCGIGRWVRRQAKGGLCSSCAAQKKGQEYNGSKSNKWRGGRKDKRGYVYVSIDCTDPFFVMVGQKQRHYNYGWVLEHRLVVARHFGRPLLSNEVVHHINGIKSDNRIENLLLLKERDHNSHLVNKDLQKRVRNLEGRMIQVETENILLKSILSEIRDSVPESNMILRRYNTLGSFSKQTEGIVQASSNRG